MSKFCKFLSLILVANLTAPSSFAQESQDVIQRAMADELKRNMEELQLEGYDKPFFIRYLINDQEMTRIHASLGALVSSIKVPNRSKGVRVMVGNYEFNDESLDPQNQNNQPMGFSGQMVPLGDDYIGIRRTLWATTDEIYRSAAKIYKGHQKYVERQKKPISEIPHRTFAKVSKVRIVDNSSETSFSLRELEEIAKSVSGLFLNYPEIEASRCIISRIVSTSYLANSEGSKVKISSRILYLNISAKLSTEKGESFTETLEYTVAHANEFPKTEQISKDVAGLVNKLNLLIVSPEFDENYIGPVLFIGKTVPLLFSQELVNNIVASDLDTDAGGYYNYQNPNSSLDKSIGKKVVSSALSISLLPFLREYNNMPLLGSYLVDDEGVVPSEELVLIKDGILNNVMTSRTLTKDHHQPTGTSAGPGVVSITSTKQFSYKELKKKLISKAIEEELDYAIIIREGMPSLYANLNVYKVSLIDGSEELFHGAGLGRFSINSFKKLLGTTKKRIPHNQVSIGKVSYIVPEGVLINNIEVDNMRVGGTEEVPLVSNPLKSHD